MTRVRCVVRECKNTSHRNDSNCSFHDFPANKELCEKWISQIIKYEEFCGWVSNVASRITSNTKICSEHFEKTCFQNQRSGEKKRLLPMAVPKLFPKPAVRKIVLLSEASSAANNCNLDKGGIQESIENIPEGDHTYGKRVIQPSDAQQPELQPNQNQDDDDVIVLPSPATATIQPSLSIPSPPRAPYDLTGRMREEPNETLPFKKLPLSKTAFILPVPTSVCPVPTPPQPLVSFITQQQKELFLATSQSCQGENTARFAYQTQPNNALQLSNSVEDPNNEISAKRARVDSPLVTSGPIRAPCDLTGRMIQESQSQTIPDINRIPACNPSVTLPMPTSASNQGFFILVPQPIFRFPPPIISTIPSLNSNCYQVSTPVASSVVASKTVTQNCDGEVQQAQQQQISEKRIVESNPETCQPNITKKMPKKTIDRRDDAYRNQANMVRKLRHRIQQMEKTHAKLLDTVGFGLYERSRKDVRIKRLFRSIDALLSGDDNGEDQPAFLIDQILNFNAKSSKHLKYSQATMRSSFALNSKSTSTYDFIRNQGVLILPCRNTLASHMKKASAKQDDDDVAHENDELDDDALQTMT